MRKTKGSYVKTAVVASDAKRTVHNRLTRGFMIKKPKNATSMWAIRSISQACPGSFQNVGQDLTRSRPKFRT